MGNSTIFDSITKHGISVVTVGAGIYLLFFLVKHTVISLTERMNELVINLKEFTTCVRKEHSDHTKNQERLALQHEEMIKTLGRINGYK